MTTDIQYRPLDDLLPTLSLEELLDFTKRELWPVFITLYGADWSCHSVATTKRGVQKEIEKLRIKYPSHRFIVFGDTWNYGHAIYATPIVMERAKEILLARGNSVTLPVYKDHILGATPQEVTK